MRVLGSLSGFLLLSLLVVGCASKLNDERSFTLEPNVQRLLTIDAPSHDQKLTVHAKSPGAAISVYCFLEKDQEAVQNALERRKMSDKVLGSKERIEDGQFEATIPAGSTAVVLVTCAAGKKANVQIKMTGQ